MKGNVRLQTGGFSVFTQEGAYFTGFSQGGRAYDWSHYPEEAFRFHSEEDAQEVARLIKGAAIRLIAVTKVG